MDEGATMVDEGARQDDLEVGMSLQVEASGGAQLQARGGVSMTSIAIAELSGGSASALSGFAMWPRLQLDVAGELVVQARGHGGAHQPSHWHTVLPLLSATPKRVAPGDQVRLAGWMHLASDADSPVRYALWADILRASALRRDPDAHALVPPSPLTAGRLPWPSPCPAPLTKGLAAVCSCASRACRRCLVETIRRCLLPCMVPMYVGLRPRSAGSQVGGMGGGAGPMI